MTRTPAPDPIPIPDPTTDPTPGPGPGPREPLLLRLADHAMALGLAVMALAVFVNVVLRYGFGSGIAASEELSRLLFVWVVFTGAAAAYPRGEHMVFDGLLRAGAGRPRALMLLVALIRLLVVLACALLGWGAWQQVLVGLTSHSVVLRYPSALLPLPALLCALAIGTLALVELLRSAPLQQRHADFD